MYAERKIVKEGVGMREKVRKREKVGMRESFDHLAPLVSCYREHIRVFCFSIFLSVENQYAIIRAPGHFII